MTGRVKFATSTAPCSPLADLVSNPTPPGQLTREQAASVSLSLRREWDFPVQPCFIFMKSKFENSCIPAIKMEIDGRLIMSAKETLLDIAEKLPPDATLVDAIYELEFRQAVEDGLASLDRDERIPLEEARKRIPQWISKYSSPTTR
jgi:hypothetical protein